MKSLHSAPCPQARARRMLIRLPHDGAAFSLTYAAERPRVCALPYSSPPRHPGGGDNCPEGGFGGCTYMSLTEIEVYGVKAP